MKEITMILLFIIAIIGIISIIIVKLFYRDKEKDEEKERLEEFINSTQSDYDDERRKRVRRSNRRAQYSEAQNYANTIDKQYSGRKVRRSQRDDYFEEDATVGGTTALLRQRAQSMEDAPKKQVRRVRKPKAEASQAPRKQSVPKKVQRTPQRVKTQMNKEEEVKPFQEPIKPEHAAAINSAKETEAQPKVRQVPMTEKQKEFIAKDANKLVVEDDGSAVKVVKSVKPADSIEEIKESAKIEDEASAEAKDITVEAEPVKEEIEEAAKEEIKETAEAEPVKEEIKETAKVEKDEVVKKAEQDTADLMQKIEEATEGAELAKKAETAKEELTKTKAKEEAKTPEIESAIEDIKKATEKETPAEAKETASIKAEREEEKPKFIDSSSKVSEKIAEVKEEVSPESKTEEIIPAKAKETAEKADGKIPEKTEVPAETIIPEQAEEPVPLKAEEEKPAFSEITPKASEEIPKAGNTYQDDLHILLNKDKKVEVDETPENEFITINSDAERESTGNDLFNNAIQSIRNFRKPNVPEKPVVVETKDDIVPDDYAQDLGDGIEYIGDTITITPIHEEEMDLANNQPNEDVDKIYKQVNKESYNKTDDEELSKSFEDVTDETSEKEPNVYTKEDYKKVENEEKEKKRRAENTKRILGSKGISESELRSKSEAKAKSRRTRKAASPKDAPVAEGQKRLNLNKTNNDVEEVYINGTLFELKVGQVVIFDIKGETYSSQILRLKPGYIGVRYRSKKIWVKSNSVKKILK